MLTLRCTRRLLRRFIVRPNLAPPEPTTKLGDWYCNLLPLKVGEYILCVSGRTLLPVVLPGSALKNLPQELAAGVSAVLGKLGVEKALIQQERFAMANWTVGQTDNRRVLGTMNEFAFAMSFRLEEEKVPLGDLALWLAETPCTAIDEVFPDRATVAAFGKPLP